MRLALVLLALVAIIALPFALKPRENQLAAADDTLVIITPHSEAIRWEFSRAFGEYYKQQTGRTVRLDWRMPGGTSEIARYLKGEYYAAFQRAWVSTGQPWTAEVAGAFDNPTAPMEGNSPAAQARRGFLNSEAGVGVDIFFGGGGYDFSQQAEAGRLVDSGVITRHPDWFTEGSIPAMVSGEVYYDPKGRWTGVVLASFGICYNTDSLRRLGVTILPAGWSDLKNPKFFRQVALADPTKSGSAAKAFEMVIQEQMEAVGADHLADGWTRGLNLIQAASSNARYFTDAAGRVPVDVSGGEAAIGMCIDFYGRFQSEAVQVGDTTSRLQFFTPATGSSISVDPIGLLRGAPHPKIAQMFIDFVLSMEGQKIWSFRPGTPGGPEKYALRRLPIRKEIYAPEYTPYRSDPTVFPYEEAKHFTYHPAWTASLFRTLSFIIRVSCLDCHDEQVAAWKALIAAGFPPQATARFQDVSAVNYQIARDQIRPTLSTSNRIEEVRLARELGNQFRAQYREAETLAEKKE